MKILLAVDGSAYTKKMLAYLTTHLEVFSANNEFTIFTVQMPLPPRARAAVGAEVANSYYAEEAEKVTAPVVKFLKRHGIEPKVVHKTGSPGEQIAKQADTGKYDLVMMGSHGHSALGNLVMGSVATQVLAHCSVPVMLVR
ncbi:universal stress protein [Hydrogenophaga pseudoflava]|jgi:nucleotide-binding universal stress UspA family protein|uniref:Universal stress protein family protein n=1 Tax=Hydrogenophaga pseudoflava TaxID=47421 RepID=A0A4P6WY66_HYDPS|nr:universal stress protein [Hydrogenophaga pseudoflava]QBM26224.1 Universal stress protein family protein [Hydrogenophaga pseudoflava]